MMSDRADFCPHCGCPKEFSAKEETSIKEENPIIEEDSVKEESSVTKAQTVSTTEDLNSNDKDDEATATQDTEEVVEEEDNANKGLVALVIVLAIIAIVICHGCVYNCFFLGVCCYNLRVRLHCLIFSCVHWCYFYYVATCANIV